MGWEILVIWECEIGDSSELKQRLCSFLEKGREGGKRVERG